LWLIKRIESQEVIFNYTQTNNLFEKEGTHFAPLKPEAGRKT
jgi:hypothetical protein